ncbi:MAG: hypothetical protein ACYCZ1_05365 [Candidatus Humimicrobiaceae bacterium]
MKKEYNGIYDVNLWYGVNNTDWGLSVSDKDLKKYVSFLKNKSEEVKLFVSSYLSYSYDPVVGDNLLARLIKEDESLSGVLIFPNYFISREDEFENYLVERLKDGFKLIRFYKAHKYEMKPWALKKIYAVLNKFKFPAIISLDDIDITGNKAIDWDLIYEIATQFKNMPIILDGGNSKEMMYSGYIFELLENCENIFIETHNLLALNQIEDIVDKFSSGKLILGSYYPDYPNYLSLERIKFARISNEDKDNIYYLNLESVIKKIKI